MRTKRTTSRLLSILLCLVMVLGLLPTAAFAAGTEGDALDNPIKVTTYQQLKTALEDETFTGQYFIRLDADIDAKYENSGLGLTAAQAIYIQAKGYTRNIVFDLNGHHLNFYTTDVNMCNNNYGGGFLNIGTKVSLTIMDKNGAGKISGVNDTSKSTLRLIYVHDGGQLTVENGTLSLTFGQYAWPTGNDVIYSEGCVTITGGTFVAPTSRGRIQMGYYGFSDANHALDAFCGKDGHGIVTISGGTFKGMVLLQAGAKAEDAEPQSKVTGGDFENSIFFRKNKDVKNELDVQLKGGTYRYTPGTYTLDSSYGKENEGRIIDDPQDLFQFATCGFTEDSLHGQDWWIADYYGVENYDTTSFASLFPKDAVIVGEGQTVHFVEEGRDNTRTGSTNAVYSGSDNPEKLIYLLNSLYKTITIYTGSMSDMTLKVNEKELASGATTTITPGASSKTFTISLTAPKGLYVAYLMGQADFDYAVTVQKWDYSKKSMVAVPCDVRLSTGGTTDGSCRIEIQVTLPDAPTEGAKYAVYAKVTPIERGTTNRLGSIVRGSWALNAKTAAAAKDNITTVRLSQDGYLTTSNSDPEIKVPSFAQYKITDAGTWTAAGTDGKYTRNVTLAINDPTKYAFVGGTKVQISGCNATTATAGQTSDGKTITTTLTTYKHYVVKFGDDDVNYVWAGGSIAAPEYTGTVPEGQEFTGWKQDDSKTYAVGELITPNDDMTLTAQFETISSTVSYNFAVACDEMDATTGIVRISEKENYTVSGAVAEVTVNDTSTGDGANLTSLSAEFMTSLEPQWFEIAASTDTAYKNDIKKTNNLAHSFAGLTFENGKASFKVYLSKQQESEENPYGYQRAGVGMHYAVLKLTANYGSESIVKYLPISLEVQEKGTFNIDFTAVHEDSSTDTLTGIKYHCYSQAVVDDTGNESLKTDTYSSTVGFSSAYKDEVYTIEADWTEYPNLKFVKWEDVTEDVDDADKVQFANANSAETTFLMPKRDVTLKAVFANDTVTGIRVTTLPGKTSYIEGDTFDSAGIEIAQVYESGNEVALTAEQLSTVTYSPTSLTAGTTEVTATYDGKTAVIPVTVTAQNAETYTITFERNGGTGTMANGTATQYVPYTLPACGFAAPDGKVFDQWKIGDKQYSAGAHYMFTANTTVTATWKDSSGAKTVLVPEANTNLVYTGSMQTGVESGDYTLVGTARATNAGTYTVYASLNGSGSYWSDGSTGTKTIQWTIAKANQTAPAAPTLASRDTTSITLNTIPGAEYSKDSKNWQTSPNFTGLSSGTSYTFYARLAGDSNHNASDPSAPATISTTSSGSSGGGGGSSSSTYAITVKDAKHGSVTADRKTASSGATVTLTVKPDQGWTLETLTATNASGKEVELNIVKVGEKYTFKMPASNVTVNATFMEDNTILNYFVDVPTDSYYYDAVLWAVDKGITQGTDDSHFNPSGICTRAQAVTFLWRAAGSPAPKSTTMPFTDVKSGVYYYDAVLWAVENGITKGTTDTTFSPNMNCSRAQIVTFLWRSEQSPAAGTVNPFTDVKADAYYADAVLWAVKEDVTKGTTDTTFSPDTNCTRAQIVTFIYRCMK